MSTGAEHEEFGADIRSLCRTVEDTGCFPVEPALRNARMRRAGVWAIEHLGEQEETIDECLGEMQEFLTRAASDPDLEDAVAALLRRHPELRAPAGAPRPERPARPPSRGRPRRP